MILLDASSVMMSSIMAQSKTFEEKPDLVRHTIFNIIRKFNLQFRDEYGEMVVCFDSKGNWRKNTFPEYKANRKKGREESDMNWKVIFDIIGQTKHELHEYSPFKTIELENCEADDIIGTIVAKCSGPEPIIIISPDKDFIQLQRYPNVKQYSNIQKKWVTAEVDAKTDLAEKVLKGDTGDGVPNVLSDNLTLVEGRRQGVLSKKKKEMLLADPESLGTSVARNIIRNRDMIDLSRVPQDLQDRIMELYDEETPGNINKLMTLFVKNRMNLMIEALSDFEVRHLDTGLLKFANE